MAIKIPYQDVVEAYRRWSVKCNHGIHDPTGFLNFVQIDNLTNDYTGQVAYTQLSETSAQLIKMLLSPHIHTLLKAYQINHPRKSFK